eukprot:CAMPEP_0176033244 /NCGR_PEP_ID=MMETSP0120_2-20121206/16418_1 /TAXON_ID=160619 /ORGANISM="Kryptoperidinium foliaceum, Strain CCMP 1326" /LENGTH=128 /DNA_ID=CAMNT_0017366569 /DNA_START=204 /DNA_END=590 /DNA_ORIENTATION=-
MADRTDFIGKWEIVEALDGEMNPFSLPDGNYFMTLQDAGDGETLSASIKVGNSMRTRIQFTGSSEEGDTIQVGGLMSTMMMPPAKLFQLEQYFSKTMPKMDLVQKETVEDETRMVFSGDGKMVWKQVE